LCAAIGRSPLPAKYRVYCPKDSFARPLHEFARQLPDLQQERHAADYDPSRVLTVAETLNVVQVARATILNWSASPAEDREAFLLLLMFPPR
jgi:hypothetical protein